MNCAHASIIKDENSRSYFSSQIYACCKICESPTFATCENNANPDWQCGSEAYGCVFGCRDEDSVLEVVVGASKNGLRRKREVIVSKWGFLIGSIGK